MLNVYSMFFSKRIRFGVRAPSRIGANLTGLVTSLSLSQVFANPNPQPGPAPVLLGPTANCSIAYTPAVGEKRLLRVSVTQSGVTTILSPDQALGSIPQALVSQTLQGIGPTGFIQ